MLYTSNIFSFVAKHRLILGTVGLLFIVRLVKGLDLMNIVIELL